MKNTTTAAQNLTTEVTVKAVKALTWGLMRDEWGVSGGVFVANTCYGVRGIQFPVPFTQGELLDALSRGDVIVHDDDGIWDDQIKISAAIKPLVGDGVVSAKFWGFAASISFRADTQEFLGVEIPSDPQIDNLLNGMAPLGFGQWHVPKKRTYARRVLEGYIQEQKRGYWHPLTEIYLPEDHELLEMIREEEASHRFLSGARRVIRAYNGTRLYGALRRAGLAEILRPENRDLLERALKEARA